MRAKATSQKRCGKTPSLLGNWLRGNKFSDRSNTTLLKPCPRNSSRFSSRSATLIPFNMIKTRCAACFLLILLCMATVPARAQNQQPTPPPFAAEPKASLAQQQNYSPQLLEQLASIKAAAMSDDYAYRQLAHLTENIGARPSGSLQAKAAVDYVAEEMRKLGLDVHLEEVKVPHWVRGAETAQLVEYAGQA